jgi:hypothetical protein
MFVYISIEFNERRKGNIRRHDKPTLLKLSENGMLNDRGFLFEHVCSKNHSKEICAKNKLHN